MPALQARLLQDRPQQVLGGAGVGGAFQDDQLAGPQVRRAASRPVLTMYDRSGSRASASGVGTQMMMASASTKRPESLVASKRPPATSSATRSEQMWPM